MGEIRIKAVAGLMLLAFLGLLARATDVQGLRSEEFERELQARRSHSVVVHPKRGCILDCRGRVLARDERSFDLYVELDELEKNPSALPAVRRLLQVPEEELQPVLDKHYEDVERMAGRSDARMRARVIRAERRYPRLVRRGIADAAAFEIELHEETYLGFQVRETLKRTYPYGSAAAHVLGYVGRVNDGEYQKLVDDGYFFPDLEEYVGPAGVARMKKSGEFMQEMLGRMGVEKSFDRVLRGRCGLATIERNVETRSRVMVDLVAAQNGQDVRLSLDIEVQKQVEEILAASEFPHQVAIVVDAPTGGILAMASKPGFDPNAFVPPIDSPRLRAYFEDTQNYPLMNRAIAGTYQLGSIFKAVTGYAGLESGLITPSSVIECKGKALDRGDAFRCWLYRQDGRTHGPLVLAEALEQSCNCYFFDLGKRLTLDQVERAAERFGFGSATGLGLPGERRGALPSFSHPRRWAQTDTMSLCIGQSSMTVTPAQVAQAMTIIANDGKRVAITIAGPKEALDDAADPALILPLREGLKRVVSGPHGTAKDAGLQKFDAAGKTSSAQTVLGQEAHAWFGGYAPADRPKYVIVTLVEHGTSGGHAAAPVASRIFEKLFHPPEPEK